MKLKIKDALINFVRPSPHSKFSPSSAERWLSTGCSYSINGCKGIPEETSIYAEEGTLAHSVCEAMFRQEFLMIPFPDELSLQIIDGGKDEMLEHARNYVDVVNFWLKNKEEIGEVLWYGIEKGIPIFPDEGCFGTADFVIVGAKGAAIIDFKYGRGKNVSANSLQLKVYATGVFKNLENIPQGYKFHSIVFQPRTDSAPKEHAYTAEELGEFMEVIWKSILISKRDDLTPVEGNHCFWCPARRTKDPSLKCPIWRDKPLKLAQEEFGKFFADMQSPPNNLEYSNKKRDAAMVKLMSLYPLIKDTVEQANEEFMMRLQNGDVIEGVRVIEVLGKRQLNAENDKEAEEMLRKAFPKLNPTRIIPEQIKVRTITDLEKELGKGKLDPFCVKKITKKVDVVDAQVQKVLGEMKLYADMINNDAGV